MRRCESCQAFVQESWTACKLCGHEVGQPAWRPGPTPGSPPPAPSRGRVPVWVVPAVALVAALVVGLALLGGGGDDGGSIAAPEEPTTTTRPGAGRAAADELPSVCETGEGVDAAADLTDEPGLHRMEVFSDDGTGWVVGARPYDLPGIVDQQSVGEVELVACRDRTGEGRRDPRCPADVLVVDEELRLLEARTGAVVFERTLADPGEACPNAAPGASAAVDALALESLAGYATDGTRPDLPPADQLELLCDGAGGVARAPWATDAAPAVVAVLEFVDDQWDDVSEFAGEFAAFGATAANHVVCLDPPDTTVDGGRVIDGGACEQVFPRMIRLTDGVEVFPAGQDGVLLIGTCAEAAYGSRFDAIEELVARTT